MLKLLENANLNKMLNILFDLLVKNRRLADYSKAFGLIIKCILKLTKTLSNTINDINVSGLLIRFHEYILEFSTKTDDIGIKAIKTILTELIKVVGDTKIFDYYKAVQNHEKKDTYIYLWITAIVR
jgi:hypothetical protein